MIESCTFKRCLENYSGTIHDLDNGVSLNSDQFRDMVKDIQNQIIRISGKRNFIVLLSMSNSLNFMAAFFGVLAAEAIPIIAKKNLNNSELERSLNEHQTNLFICDYDLKLKNDETDVLLKNKLYYRLLQEDCKTGNGLKEKYGVLILHPTSGTTGESRLCVRDERSCMAEPLNHIDTVGCKMGFSILSVLPLNHAYGFGSAFLLGMIQSCNMYLISEFNPRKIITVLSREIIDYMPANPIVLELLMKTKSRSSFQVPCHILSAGSVLRTKVVKDFYDRFGVYVKASYGSTETGEICLQRNEGLFPEGCVGQVLNHTEIEIRNLDGMNVLFVKNPSLMNGYLLKDGRVDTSAIGTDGFFPTKDIAQLDNDLTVVLSGRLNDVINKFGIKIIPREIEQVISTFPGVQAVCVYGKQDKRGYEEICAVIDTHYLMEEILDLCRKHLTDNMIPKNIYLQPVPKTETGKIIRELLP